MAQIQTAMDKIQRISNERQAIWRKSDERALTPDEAARLSTIEAELAVLWDAHRREYAASRNRSPMTSTRVKESSAYTERSAA